jgi:hypothetical protein
MSGLLMSGISELNVKGLGHEAKTKDKSTKTKV